MTFVLNQMELVAVGWMWPAYTSRGEVERLISGRRRGRSPCDCLFVARLLSRSRFNTGELRRLRTLIRDKEVYGFLGLCGGSDNHAWVGA